MTSVINRHQGVAVQTIYRISGYHGPALSAPTDNIGGRHGTTIALKASLDRQANLDE